MNILEQSYNISLDLLPKAKQARNTKNKFFHFAFAYKKNKLLAIGQNNPEKTHTQALMLSKRFLNEETDYPYLHAETDVISKLWGKYYIDNTIKLVIVRLNKRPKNFFDHKHFNVKSIFWVIIWVNLIGWYTII
jgi:hypothetical protein